MTDTTAAGSQLRAPSARHLASGAAVLSLAVLLSTCQADKLLSPPSTGTLVVNPSQLADSAAVGSVAVRVRGLEILTDGAPDLDWQAQKVLGSAWLVMAANGTAPDTVTVSLNPAGLAVGIYRDTVVLTSSNSDAAPLRIPVEFSLHPCRDAALSLDAVVAVSLSSAECTSPALPGHYARRYQFAAAAGDSLSVELQTTGFDGFIRLDTVTASPPPTPYPPSFAETGECFGVSGDPCIHYLLLPATRDYVLEVTTATPGATGTISMSVHRPRGPAAPDTLTERARDSVTTLGPGNVAADTGVVLRASITDPDGVDSIRLEVEVRPVGTPFTNAPTATSSSGPVRRRAFALVDRLGDDRGYHWQARTLDQTGRASAWVSAGANPETSPDFAVNLPQVPAAATALAQFKEDGTTPIALGGITDTRSAVFRGVVTDPDPGDQLRLEVEVRALGVAFTGTPSASSAPQGSGGTATVTVAGLSDNTSYHWRARTVDQTARASAWVPFGGNPETSADFAVQVPANSLVFAVQPSSTVAGATITPAVQVRALDAQGNTSTSFTGAVTIAIETGPPGATLTGTTTVNAVAGIATFSNLQLPRAGAGYTLRATAASLAITSAAFTVTPGAASKLAFTVQPASTVANATITPAVLVTALDQFDNTATGFTGSVTIAIGTNPGGGTLTGTLTRAAVAGAATFNDLSINRTGTGYTLAASAANLSGATSAVFDIVPAGATRLLFSVEPTTTVAGATVTPALQVRAVDASGNTVTSFNGTIGLAIQANPASGTLSGNTSRNAVSGTATFNNLSIDKAGSGYTLLATATALGPDTSAAFTITPATVTKLAFTVQPPASTTAGAVMTPAVVVAAQDQFSNTVTSFTGSVTVAIGTNPASGTLSGTLTVAATAGLASFSTLSIDKAATGYTLSVASTGLTPATSAAFAIAAAPATRLAYSVQPGNTVAGVAITPAVQVTAQDAYGNTATSFTGSVTVAIGTNPGGGTLSGTAVRAAVAGIATFNDLRINRTGTGYTLTASATGLTGATSAAFNISPAPGSVLVFTVQPASATAGQVITPAVQVTARDSLGNVATTFTGNVTVAIGTNPGGGTLSGTLVRAAVAGVATFNDLKINLQGTGYTLTASATGLTTGTSAAFNIAAAAATNLVFTVQPTTTVAGAVITPAVQVTARDSLGNTVTTFTGSVTVAIGANPGSGALSGVLTRAAVAGVATFNDLSINRSGTGYTLTAAAAGTAGTTSASFNITGGTATQLVFTVQPPASATARQTLSPAVQVTARDILGNTATGFTGNVTMAIGTNPGGATLSGTTTVAAVAGVATFGNLSLNKAGTGYTLTATSGAIPGATSTALNITPGPTTQLAFTVQPALNTSAGAPVTPAIQVSAWDADSNLTPTFTQTVAITMGSNPGGATLSGTTSVAAVGGVATFSNLSLNRTGTGYTLIAARGGLISDESTPFNITPALASTLAFTVQPSNAVAGAAIAPAVEVTARDPFGNVATNFTANVTVAISTNPAGGTLTGTTTRAAVAGVATFNNLSINRSGAGYALSAAATGLTGATSDPFTIASGPASVLAFTVQPVTTLAGVTIAPAVQVTARDALGNTATDFTGIVNVAIGTNPGAGTLSGTTSVTALAGIATFNTLSIDRVGTGYTLTAGSTGLTGATSGGFNITAGAATQLAFTVQPANTAAGAVITPPIQVTARDAFGNTATSFTGLVTVSIGTNPGGATLSGTPTAAAVAGVATFSNLSLNKTGTGYTLSANATGLAAGTSAAFNVTPAAATKLAFTVQPTPTVAGVAIAPSVLVTAQDQFDNTVTTFTGNVTVAIGTNPGGGTLSGTAVRAAVAGIATFNDLRINRTGTGYTLTANAASLTGATSAAFDIVAGAAASIALVSGNNQTDTIGATLPSPFVVRVTDGLGNGVAGIQVNWAVTGGGGSITPSALTDAGGLAQATRTLGTTVGAQTATAEVLGLAGSPVIFTATANPGNAAILVFTVQPSNTAAGASITPAPQVTARDRAGNTATGFTGSVTAAIGTNPAAGTLSGVLTHAAVAGVATFAGLSIDKAGVGYTLTASATGLTGATSATFTITAGAVSASQSTVSAAPTTITASSGGSLSTITVTARDQFGNPITGATVTLAATGGGNAVTQPGATTNASGVTTGALSSTVAEAKTVSATINGVAVTQTAAVTVQPGGASQLAFTVQPTNATAGVAITPAVQVTARDAFGNTATGFTDNVTVALGANPGAGVLSGTLTQPAAAGIATFPGLAIDKAGAGYTLTAGSGALTGATSAAFTISAGTATAIALVSGDAQTDSVGATLPAQYVVRVTDAQGNGVSGVTVTWAVTGGGGSITPSSVTNPSGNAQATRVLGNTLGAQTATATVGGLAGSPVGFTATATPGNGSQLAFSVQPSATVAGVAITPAIVVTARDRLGNTATGFTGNVTVAIGTNPGGGALSGTATQPAVAGVATFANLSIDRVGTGYTLTAAATGLTGTTSTAFNITPAAATQLAFTVQPTATAAGAAITPAVVVTARDQFGNTATGFIGGVTVAIGANPGGGILSGTVTQAAAAGVATFAGLSIDKVGTGYTLSANSGGLAGATSVAFNITSSGATRLAFTVEPTNATAGAAISPAIQVTARDAFGNTATAFTGNVTIAIGTNAGGGTLSGTATQAAVAGIATFANLSIDKAGTGYTLTAGSGALTSATSAGFNITSAAATQLAFTVQPANATAGAAITPAVVVTARDQFGNTAIGFSGNVTVAIGTNPAGGTLSGTAMVAAASGVATFATLSIDRAGTGYTLTASAAGLPGSTSAAFNVTAATATVLVFTVQPPGNVTAGQAMTPAVQVTARDQFGNTATGFTEPVTMAIGTNPAGGTLSGTTSQAAVAGVATFADLSIDKAASGYTLAASATGVAGTASNTFTVRNAAAAALVFDVQPANTTVNSIITPAVRVRVVDDFGNTFPFPRTMVTVALANNPGGATLGGTLTQQTGQQNQADSGVAVFNNLTLNQVGTGYTLSATATGVTGTTSAAFTINPGPAASLHFTTQPVATAAGAPITPSVAVTARDAFGNTATSFTGNVTVAIGINPAGGVLSGTPARAASAGVASFNDLSIDKAGTGYTLTAAATGLTGATSSGFNISAGSVSASLSTVSGAPATITASSGASQSTITVTARDALGNPVSGATVVLAATGTGNTLTQPVGTTNASGVATGTLSSTVAEAKTVSATINTIGITQTAIVTVQAATVSAAQSTVDATPTTITADGSSQSTITVTARDQFDNPISGVTVVLAATGTGNTLTPPIGNTDASGVATGTLSSTVAEVKIVSATINGVAITQTATVTVNP